MTVVAGDYVDELEFYWNIDPLTSSHAEQGKRRHCLTKYD